LLRSVALALVPIRLICDLIFAMFHFLRCFAPRKRNKLQKR
jgi:hypothetical protein